MIDADATPGVALTPAVKSSQKSRRVITSYSIHYTKLYDTLDQWTGKYFGPHSGIVVTDPLDGENLVVTFLQPTAGGDIFSDEFPVADGFLVTLSFDYLGLEVDGSEPGRNNFV